MVEVETFFLEQASVISGAMKNTVNKNDLCLKGVEDKIVSDNQIPISHSDKFRVLRNLAKIRMPGK